MAVVGFQGRDKIVRLLVEYRADMEARTRACKKPRGQNSWVNWA